MKNKSYTTELKIQALELARQTGSFAEAARQLGVKDNLLHNWKKKYNISMDPKSKGAAESFAEAEEIKRLRKQVLDLEKSNYILKRASAFFSQDLLK